MPGTRPTHMINTTGFNFRDCVLLGLPNNQISVFISHYSIDARKLTGIPASLDSTFGGIEAAKEAPAARTIVVRRNFILSNFKRGDNVNSLCSDLLSCESLIHITNLETSYPFIYVLGTTYVDILTGKWFERLFHTSVILVEISDYLRGFTPCRSSMVQSYDNTKLTPPPNLILLVGMK